MKPFRNKGWQWFDLMEQILPFPTVDGSYAFAPSQSHDPPFDAQEDESQPSATSLQAPGSSNFGNINSSGPAPASFLTPPPSKRHPADVITSYKAPGLSTSDEMNVDSSGHPLSTIPFIMEQPGHVSANSNFTMQQLASTGVSNKRHRTFSDNDESGYRRSPTPPQALSTSSRWPAISSDKCSIKKKSSNRDAKSLSHPSANSAASAPSAPSASSVPSAPSAASALASTSQRVAKMTPAVALVTLKTQ